MIKPTVGRVILYHPPFVTGEPEAAIVSGVNSDGTVNICAFTHYGFPHGHSEVPVKQDDSFDASLHQATGWCEWMEYQKGQAARTDDVAGKLSKLVDELSDRVTQLELRTKRV